MGDRKPIGVAYRDQDIDGSNNSTIQTNDVVIMNISGGVGGAGDYLAYVGDIGTGLSEAVQACTFVVIRNAA
jgi:hypothetical protein